MNKTHGAQMMMMSTPQVRLLSTAFMTLRVYYINLSRYIGSCGRRFRRKLSIKLSVFNKIVTYQKMFSGGLTLLTSSNNHDEDDGNEKIII